MNRMGSWSVSRSKRNRKLPVIKTVSVFPNRELIP